ncbi:MAG: hypothetical protein JOZ70_15965, partial [Pseudolabrys sp.]|nr:hypothetical protein [Pseudolabrys sp.]
LQYDTGGYLARWYEGYLVPSRAVAYGLMLAASAGLNFWPVVVLQAALTVWTIHLLLRVHGCARPSALVGAIAALSLLTALPWLSAILLTDIFTGLSVLALYMLMFRFSDLSKLERAGLIGIAAIGAATHSATLAVLLGLVAVSLAYRSLAPEQVRLRNAFIAILLGVVTVFVCNFALTKRVAWTPGGFALSFGRMLQDGIVARYLDEHCPDQQLRLCPHRAELPRDADAWFWGNPTFIKLGRFAGLGDEMTTIALKSIAAYPGMQVQTAAMAAARQLTQVHTGEGVLTTIWHTYAIIEKFTPSAAPAMRAARQQRGELSFTWINTVNYPVALLAIALLPILLVTARGGTFARETAQLAAIMTVALLGNAAVCGILSNPHDRYGARIAWLAVLSLMVAALAALRQREARPHRAPLLAPVGDLA